jgi:hypothetical protein
MRKYAEKEMCFLSEQANGSLKLKYCQGTLKMLQRYNLVNKRLVYQLPHFIPVKIGVGLELGQHYGDHLRLGIDKKIRAPGAAPIKLTHTSSRLALSHIGGYSESQPETLPGCVIEVANMIHGH